MMKSLVFITIQALLAFTARADHGICVTDDIRYDDYLRVISGKTIQIAEAPYQVALESNDHFICGGVLIAPKFVLTAAHCVDPKNTFTFNPQVRVGTNLGGKGGMRYAVESYEAHPDYNRRTVENDIALIMLKSSVDITPLATPICINPTELSAGEIAFLSGYGDTHETGKRRHSMRSSWDNPDLKLYGIKVPIISFSACMAYHGDEVFSTNVCTKSDVGNAGACYGDSGGPLTVNGTLVGIVSWGDIFCDEEPSVFTKVKEYIPWILSTAEEMADDNE